MMDYRYEKTGDPPRHTWALVGPEGAVHIWAQMVPRGQTAIFGEPLYGGVECHWRKPQEYHGEDWPHHEKCWLLDGPCWHDGSSLYFSEKIAPVLALATDMGSEAVASFVNAELDDWYRDKIAEPAQ